MAKNNRSNRNDWGVLELARERPIAAAATAVGAAAAGLFLWSKRTQISEQLSSLSDQVSQWKNSVASGAAEETLSKDYGIDDLTRTTTSSRPTPSRSRNAKRRGETGPVNQQAVVVPTI